MGGFGPLTSLKHPSEGVASLTHHHDTVLEDWLLRFECGISEGSATVCVASEVVLAEHLKDSGYSVQALNARG